MAKHCRPLGTARPVVARAVLAGWKRPAVGLRAGQDIVAVGRVAGARDHRAALGERGLRAQLVAVAVQIIDALRDDLVFEVLPGTVADTVTGIDRLRTALG